MKDDDLPSAGGFEPIVTNSVLFTAFSNVSLSVRSVETSLSVDTLPIPAAETDAESLTSMPSCCILSWLAFDISCNLVNLFRKICAYSKNESITNSHCHPFSVHHISLWVTAALHV